MNIPGYDAWRLRGPEEDRSEIMEACEACGGFGCVRGDLGETYECDECLGAGEVLAVLDEPDDSYEYERRRDAQMDRG